MSKDDLAMRIAVQKRGIGLITWLVTPILAFATAAFGVIGWVQFHPAVGIASAAICFGLHLLLTRAVSKAEETIRRLET